VYVASVVGSFNPVHRMHVGMFEHVKASLEAAGHTVVGAFMSPSHDSYLASKMRKTRGAHIKDIHRLRMCQLAGILFIFTPYSTLPSSCSGICCLHHVDGVG
jgi:nicotinic acid mononucleotide adenylyltransferase